MSWFSSKPKEREYTGFMGDTSPQQEQVLAQFKDWVKANEFDPIGRFDDYDMLRFCRARKFVLADIQLMFTNFINWRRENGVDTVLWDFDFTEREQVRDIYPQNYHGVDKQGRPIYIEVLGTLDVKKLFEVTTEARVLKNYAHSYELLMNLRYPACSELAGRRIQ